MDSGWRSRSHSLTISQTKSLKQDQRTDVSAEFRWQHQTPIINKRLSMNAVKSIHVRTKLQNTGFRTLFLSGEWIEQVRLSAGSQFLQRCHHCADSPQSSGKVEREKATLKIAHWFKHCFKKNTFVCVSRFQFTRLLVRT